MSSDKLEKVMCFICSFYDDKATARMLLLSALEEQNCLLVDYNGEIRRDFVEVELKMYICRKATNTPHSVTILQCHLKPPEGVYSGGCVPCSTNTNCVNYLDIQYHGCYTV